MRNGKTLSVTLLCGMLAGALSASADAAVDVDAAKGLARQNSCFKCHGTDKDKDGPSYKKVAEKYRGKPDAEQTLIRHLTTSPKVKFPDGHEEEHRTVKTRDMGEIKNLADWILSL